MVYYVTKRINMEPTSVNNFGPSAWECYIGVKINYWKVLQASFGDYCLADTKSGDNSMEPRARGAIALYEAGDFDANWWVFHLDTKKVLTRYKVTVLPVPDIVISYLNGLHDKNLMWTM